LSIGLNIVNYSGGQYYLGGFIGRAKKKEEWLAGMVEKWMDTVNTCSIVAQRYPQTSFTGFTSVCRMNCSMFSKWSPTLPCSFYL
jgi:hypothetical protein